MAGTEKISISIGRGELRGAKRLASRLRVSLSTVITDAVRFRIEEQERREAAAGVLESFTRADRASRGEQEALLARWAEKRPHPKRARRTG